MNWFSGSLVHPPVVDEDAVADPPGSCLLDRKLFVGDRTNDTTAWYDPPEDDEMSIQVTLFVAPPPRVSCILAWCTETYFTEQPMVVSTHDGLVLLSIAFSRKNYKSPEYYIYQPFSNPRAGEDRLLELIPQPSDSRLVDEHCTVGLLSSHDGSGGYHIAVLTMSMQAKGVFDLYVFSSETKNWTVKNPTVSLPVGADDVDFDDYMADKAIPLGGGSMAFVDFCKGILICNVLDGGESPELHYLPLPSDCQPSLDAYPYKPHDLTIAISSDTIRIKFANVVLLSGGWRTDTWIATTTAMSPWSQLVWKIHSTVNDRELSVPGNIDLSGLLDHGDDKLTLGSLFVEKPMLSLREDNIVCFMAKRDIMDREVWVIAVDMEKQELQGVIPLGTGRVTTLIYSTISGHLNNVAAAASTGEKGDLKRLGPQQEPYPHNKKQQLSMVASLVGEEEQSVTETDDGDDGDSVHKKQQQQSMVASLVGEEEQGLTETDAGDDVDSEQE